MSPDGTPNDPFSSLNEGAAQMHEIFLSYKVAGFTDEQSMRLVIVTLREILRSSMSGNG
jgi:hypothetical protein